MHASKNNYLTAKFRGGASLGNDGGRISALNWGKTWRIVGKDRFHFFINRFEILGEGRWMWCLGFLLCVLICFSTSALSQLEGGCTSLGKM